MVLSTQKGFVVPGGWNDEKVTANDTKTQRKYKSHLSVYGYNLLHSNEVYLYESFNLLVKAL